MTGLVCWQPVLTDHQRHTLDALGREIGSAPDYIVATPALRERETQGWGTVDAALTQLPATDLRAWVTARLLGRPDVIHIFCSPFGDRRLIAVLRQVLASGARVWLVSEPWSPVAEAYFSARPTLGDRAKAALRPWLYRGYGLMLRRRIEGVFAISPLAVSQYGRIGFAPRQVIPFGYFVPGPTVIPDAPAAGPTLRVVFVGAMIARKGVTDLAAAAAILADRGVGVTIDAFGPGTAPPGLTHRGSIAFGDAGRVIAGYDILVAPSRHDGWGVVVNEALMAGVPVVASDRTGAGAMLPRWGCGSRFRAGDAADLAATLALLATDAAALARMRAAARAIAPALTPRRAGVYMAAALRGVPEPNPWY